MWTKAWLTALGFPFVQCRVCVCVCVHLSLGVADVAVLDAQHSVAAGAAAGGLLEQAAALQRRRHAGQRPVAHAPRLAEAVHVPLASAG